LILFMIIFTSTIPSAHCMSSLRRAISNLYDDAHADKPAFATITVSNLAKYSALPTLRKFDRLLDRRTQWSDLLHDESAERPASAASR
jgi:hypothetical protein